MTSWFQAAFKLLFFLILLPAFVTFLHLQHVQQRAHLLFIGPAAVSSLYESADFKPSTSLNELFGMYQGISNDKHDPPRLFSKAIPLPRWHTHWPSIARVSTILATPTSTLLKRHSVNSNNSHVVSAQIVYDSLQNKWCAQATSQSIQVCSSQVGDSTATDSGIWTNGKDSIEVLYRVGASQKSKSTIASPYDSLIPKKFRRNPNKQSRAINRNLQQFLKTPTTILLIAVNVLLAFIYWNRGTSPSSVSKVYNKIVADGQYWRAFTGAMAHFEPLHIGFNMMTLYSLGTELEPSYGSVPFLFYNISLIPITTCIMMGLAYLQIRYTGNAALGETSTVGYSGVLFCWLVIASLEGAKTCPIPFFPDVCFDTHEFGPFRFNVGPIIQLFVMQMIMRRVSFVGHLAGIVAGFLLHWNLLPLELVQPEVLIPGMYLLLLWRARHVIPVRRQQDEDDNDDGESALVADSPPNSSRFDGRHIKRERDELMHRLLVWIRGALVINVVLSLVVFDIFGGMFLAPLFGLFYFQFCVQCHALLLDCPRDSTEYDNEKSRLGSLWKGFILSNVLTVVSDSMSLAGWIVSSVYWQSNDGSSVRLTPACIMLLFRLTVQWIALTLSCKNLSDIGETGGGLFVIMFGSTVLESARLVGNTIYSRISKSNWTAFQGHGITLGSLSALATDNTSSDLV